MAVLRFDPNTPLEVALKFDVGKRVQSRIQGAPDQAMYSLCGDETIYVPLAVEEQITKLGIKKIELISICKRQTNSVTRWEVQRVSEGAEPPTPIESQLKASIEHATAQRAQSPAKASPAAQPGPTLVKAEHSNGIPAAPPELTIASKLVASALVAAIDGLLVAADYAKAKGLQVTLALDFNAEDVRALAATTYIQAFKSGLCQPANEVRPNGGERWPQQ